MLEDLKMAISEKDIDKSRKIMTEELIGTDYPHEVFKDAIELAETYGIFEENTDDNLKTEPKEWNMEYLQSLLGELTENFSKEKFMTAYYVARKLEKEIDIQENGRCSCIKKTCKEHKRLLIASAAGAIAAGIIGISIGVYFHKKSK